jgi:hypothetical protein
VSTVTSSTVNSCSAPPFNPVLGKALGRLLVRARPRRIVETGTYLGLGSTLSICEALTDNDLPADQFYSIEVNPNFYAQAWTHLGQRGYHPRLLRGLSIPRSLLPGEAELRRSMTEQAAAALRRETYFPEALDDLLGFVLGNFDHAPDFLFLDSAEHLGFIEFQYAFSRIQTPCYLALNGVRQKHAPSLQAVVADPRFQLLEVSLDQDGYCLAHFRP